ncbi:MAG: HPr family phosphocarrier protein [Clostridia bacterium]|nr:HPr family phosphocarrier protein [Clostridia bacterium]
MIRTPIAFPADQVLQRSTATQFVQVANHFDARIMIERKDKIVNAKSMLGLLSLGVGGDDMILLVDGPEEEKAAEAILALMKELFA